MLIPKLDSSDAELDEALYAATVILRLYEEISGILHVILFAMDPLLMCFI